MRDRRQFSLRLFCLALLTALVAAFAPSAGALAGQDGTWTISSSMGQVQIVRSGASPVALTTGDALRPGDLIETGADSHAVLVRDSESIVVSPNSRMGLPEANDSGFATRILQQAGTLLLKVQKKPQHHFEVKTPYLAAVVKGTTFSVSVDTAAASVHVLEGAVQVADLGGQIALVRPGQTALVPSSGTGLTVYGAAPQTPATEAAAPQAGDSPSDPVESASHEAAGTQLPASVEAPAVSITETIGSPQIDVSVATNGLISSPNPRAVNVASVENNGRFGETSPGKSGEAPGIGNKAEAPAVGLEVGLGAPAQSNAGGAPAAGNPGGASVGLGTPVASVNVEVGAPALAGGTLPPPTASPAIAATTKTAQGVLSRVGLGGGN